MTEDPDKATEAGRGKGRGGGRAGGRAGTKPDPGQGQVAGPEAALHVVATPIGAARDISLRALDILARADLLLAEDTRTLRKLLEIHGIHLDGRRIWAYHDHNGARLRPRVMAALAEGRSVALVSDAGTPLIADPGFQLVRAAIADGHAVRAAPGASALLAALAVAGLPTDRFAFLGFSPTSAGARRSFLAQAMQMPMTTVIYESPRRVHRMLGDCCEIDPERPAALCRELTKRFEEVIRGTVAQIANQLAERELKGEVVMVLGAAVPQDAEPEDVTRELRVALSETGVRQASERVAARFGLSRREVYQRALVLRGEAEDEGDMT